MFYTLKVHIPASRDWLKVRDELFRSCGLYATEVYSVNFENGLLVIKTDDVSKYDDMASTALHDLMLSIEYQTPQSEGFIREDPTTPGQESQRYRVLPNRDPDKSPSYIPIAATAKPLTTKERIWGTVVALGLIAVVGIIGLGYGFLNHDQPTPDNPPQYPADNTSDSQTPRRQSTEKPVNSPVEQADYVTSEVLDTNYYEGYQVNLSQYPAAGPNEVYVIHGDITGTATCSIIATHHGESPASLNVGRATWRLVRITGTSDTAIEKEISRIQAGAAAHAGSDCPRIPH